MGIIPSSIRQIASATNGERKLHEIFKDLYDNDEDVHVWYEPPPVTVRDNIGNHIKKFTDFIIFHPKFGILNLEVKDWPLNHINKISHNKWDIISRHNKIISKENPFEQSRRCAYGIKERLLKEPLLVQDKGNHKNHLKFPFAWCVVFSEITSKQLESLQLSANNYLSKDDITFDVSDKEHKLAFEQKLKDMFDVKFQVQINTNREFKALRKAIWPELEVTPIRAEEKKTDIDQISLLDLKQENFAKSLGDGHYLVKGVAGSGKTLVLAYRIKYFRKLHPDWKILFVCYNISLIKYVSAILKNIFGEDKIDNIDILNFHALVKKMTGKNCSKLDRESFDEWDERMGLYLLTAISEKRSIYGKYDAIMIDEAQDFTTDWLKGIVGLLNDNDSLTISYDPAQDVLGRKRVWIDAGIDVRYAGGQRSQKLKVSYRNTIQILKLAAKFKGLDSNAYIQTEEDVDSPLIPEIIFRPGEKAKITKYDDLNSTLEQIKIDIKQLINSKRYNYKDISIICATRESIRYVKNYFTNKIPTKSLAQSEDRRNLDFNSNEVKLITFESSRGLEWKAVFLLGVGIFPREGHEEKRESNIVYIGLTRAQELLYIYYTKESEFVKTLVTINNEIEN